VATEFDEMQDSRVDDHDLAFGFDPEFYRAAHVDLAHLTRDEALTHFLVHGHKEGRCQSIAGNRETLLQQIPGDLCNLEIGPFNFPQVHGAQTRYADFLSTAELKERAASIGFEPSDCPRIDYVLRDMALEDIEDRFASVFSSHCIEHQTDLIAHLHGVAHVLQPGGRYYLIVPDKRYCFDHFISESTTLDVLLAHAERRRLHSLRSILAATMMTTHNDPVKHWEGDHGQPSLRVGASGGIERAITMHSDSLKRGEYLDVHAWQFTPRGFHAICNDLFEAGLSDLRPLTTCAPMRNRTEFCSILQKDR